MKAGWSDSRKSPTAKLLLSRCLQAARGKARVIPEGETGVPEKQPLGELMLDKVRGIALAFWIIKITSTTVGETGADYVAKNVGLGTVMTDAIMASLLTAMLVVQLLKRSYVPWVYWLTVVLVSVVGTQITDALTDGLEVSLYLSTTVFALALAATFAVWYASERTLSIHTIVTTRRELFYLSAILFTFALGTAAGYLATEALQLGFQLGVIVFGALIAVVALAYFGVANPVLTFWIAYVLTRPLAASLGDLLSQAKPTAASGWVRSLRVPFS